LRIREESRPRKRKSIEKKQISGKSFPNIRSAPPTSRSCPKKEANEKAERGSEMGQKGSFEKGRGTPKKGGGKHVNALEPTRTNPT